jgi:stage V sporulation protein B
VLGAKAFFILTGLAQQTVLPRVIGLDGYGALARVQALANIVNNVVITSSIQGVSRAVAQTPDDRAGEPLRRCFKVHAAVALPLAAAFFFLAPAYARFQKASHIVLPVQVVSLVVLAYALYAPLIGALNGQRRFSRQAALDVTYATLRTAGILGVGWLLARGGHGLLGACLGFAAAALLILPVALRATGLGREGPAGPSVRRHLAFVLPVAGGQLAVQGLMQGDITVLGRFASKLVETQGLAGEAAREAADKIVGVYKACQLFAFLPYQLLISVTFILFPMLAKAAADNDRAAVARYARAGMRLSLVFACVLVASVTALPPHLLRLAFPPEVGERGAEALRILALGQGAFALFYVETTVLTSLGRERVSALLTAGAAVLLAALCWAAGASAHTSAELLERTALGTSAALGAASVAGAVLVRRVAGAFAAPLTLARVLLALAATTFVGTLVPYRGKLLVVPSAAAMALLTLGLLAVTRELGRADLDAIRAVARRRGTSAPS